MIAKLLCWKSLRLTKMIKSWVRHPQMLCRWTQTRSISNSSRHLLVALLLNQKPKKYHASWDLYRILLWSKTTPIAWVQTKLSLLRNRSRHWTPVREPLLHTLAPLSREKTYFPYYWPLIFTSISFTLYCIWLGNYNWSNLINKMYRRSQRSSNSSRHCKGYLRAYKNDCIQKQHNRTEESRLKPR